MSAAGFDAIRAAEDRFQVETYAHLPLAVVEGRGCTVVDSEGREWLDLYGGHAVALTGHNHPRVVAAIKAQADRLLFYSNAVYNDARARAAEALVGIAPEGVSRVFFCNSGAEANEAALKTARMVTGRDAIVAMNCGFHGRTLGALSVTGLGKYRDYGGPLVPGTRLVPFGDLPAAAAVVDDDVAAVILETIPSMGGVLEADPDYHRGLRRLCDERGVLLIHDEIQTGLGRTGTLWGGGHAGVVPDLHTLAKGLGSGFPCGAVLFQERVAAKVGPGDHGSTFGGGPLAAAAIEATVRVIEDEGLVARAAAAGARLRAGAEAIDGVREVRGRGLLLAIAVDRPARTVLAGLREHSILASGIPADPGAIRLLPPLALADADIDRFLDALAGVLAEPAA